MMFLRYAVALLFSFTVNTAFSDPVSSLQIDHDAWNVISQSVANADIEAMAATYHPDAVLVNDNGTTPVSAALVKWGEGMKEARTKGSTASVSFRFKTRQDDDTSAFETGIFKYTATEANGKVTVMYMNFETLLVKKNDRWLFVMERQLGASDESSWEASGGH